MNKKVLSAINFIPVIFFGILCLSTLGEYINNQISYPAFRNNINKYLFFQIFAYQMYSFFAWQNASKATDEEEKKFFTKLRKISITLAIISCALFLVAFITK